MLCLCRLAAVIQLHGKQDMSKVVCQEKLMLDTHSMAIPPTHQRDLGLIPGRETCTTTNEACFAG